MFGEGDAIVGGCCACLGFCSVAAWPSLGDPGPSTLGQCHREARLEGSPAGAPRSGSPHRGARGADLAALTLKGRYAPTLIPVWAGAGGAQVASSCPGISYLCPHLPSGESKPPLACCSPAPPAQSPSPEPENSAGDFSAGVRGVGAPILLN